MGRGPGTPQPASAARTLATDRDANVCSYTWVVTGAAASTTPGSNPTPNPTRAPASPGGNSPPGHWSGTSETKIRGTVTRDGDGWVAYLRLEDPPELSPITTVGRFATVKEAQIAADEVGVPMTGRDAHSSGTTGVVRL